MVFSFIFQLDQRKSHQLIFLHKTTNSNEQDEVLHKLNELRQIVDYIKLINNIEQALQFIRPANKIHSLENVRSIYIYEQEQQCHVQWTSEYTKIREIYIDWKLLLNALRSDVEQYLHEEKHGIFSEIGRDNYTSDIYTFSWWNYVISLICHLSYSKYSYENFLVTLREYYQGKEVEMKILDEFERDYSSDTAIRWYTRNTFLYLVINKALRQKNIEVIFLFAFLIKDIYNQLKRQHETLRLSHLVSPIINVYRGQMISFQEIRQIKAATYLITNSFFSTSLDPTLASFLIGSSTGPNDPIQHIFFEIEIDLRIICQPFGLISSLSYFPNEDEVLFMIGTYFKVIQCSYDEHKQIYIGKLQLDIDSSLERKPDLTGMTSRQTLKAGAIDISRNLYRVGERDINVIFNQLNQLFPHEKQWLNAVHSHTLAILYRQFHIKHYPEYVDITLSNFQYALNIYQSYLDDYELNFRVNIADIYLAMGSIYRIYVKDEELANQQYDRGIEFCVLSLQITGDISQRIELYRILVWMHESKIAIEKDENIKTQLTVDAIK
ncbi:unnamed protein product [Adineta ricciae]|uniref:NAD(P)(+)--arginine ADP-ribosyltransferase n=1 Tax=Adineta ricciae TaxID=249248 RepID=A0A815Q6X8_ADIRI|nr:unnamed protein product [Adineta ricciae]